MCEVDGKGAIFCGDGGAGVGVVTVVMSCFGGCEIGTGGLEFVRVGGSMRLAMDGEALARFAERAGVGETGGALKELCDSGGASMVVERMGS